MVCPVNVSTSRSSAPSRSIWNIPMDSGSGRGSTVETLREHHGPLSRHLATADCEESTLALGCNKLDASAARSVLRPIWTGFWFAVALCNGNVLTKALVSLGQDHRETRYMFLEPARLESCETVRRGAIEADCSSKLMAHQDGSVFFSQTCTLISWLGARSTPATILRHHESQGARLEH